MRTWRIAFFLLLFLVSSTSAFARGSAGADCDGDGYFDIRCSGTLCVSLDAGVVPGMDGFCECARADGTKQKKTCSDRPEITFASYLESNELWLYLFPLGSATENSEPDDAAVQEADQPRAIESAQLSQEAA